MRVEKRGNATLFNGDSLACCREWPAPVVIISDGPYGVGGYDGDPTSPHGLACFYEPHVAAWSKQASAQTTLWFWNTEIGWANVHPVLEKHGWRFMGLNIWNKGKSHIAGNCNTKTIRHFPTVTEVCAHYVRDDEFVCKDDGGVGAVPGNFLQDWLRSEWARTGLPFNQANVACGVKSAATRKYLSSDHLWYMPPPDMMRKLVDYANEHGDPQGRPYFQQAGKWMQQANKWMRVRGKFTCPFGVTNVWDEGALRGKERVKQDGKAMHPNQKPLALARLVVEASSDEEDVVWEPFGGLFTFALSSHLLGRKCFAAEIDPDVYRAGVRRFDELK